MRNLKWRSRAAVVGYIDVVLALIAIIGTIVSAVAIAVADHKISAATKQPAEVLEPEKKESTTNKSLNSGYIPKSPVTGDFFVPLTIIWIAIGMAAVLTVMQLVSAIRMLKATELNYDPASAICPSKCWLFVNVIMILVSAPTYIFILGPLGSAGYTCGLIFRFAMMYVVYHFMKELVEITGGISNKIVSNKSRIRPA